MEPAAIPTAPRTRTVAEYLAAPRHAGALRALLRDVHPRHRDRAELVAAAVRSALAEESP